MARRKRTSHNPEDEPDAEPEPLSPYAALAAAFLQRVVWDAKGKEITGSGMARDMPKVEYEARQFLEDEAAVEWWIELTGCESEKVLPTLYKEAMR
jgi:hypothetical protein